MFHAIMDIIGSESNWVTKTICKHLLSLVSCWWLWLIKTWSRDILWQKTIWASYHTVIHILNIQWSTCFLEIGLLLHMQCKWTQLSVTEDGINLDAWSLISSPYCSVRIIIQTLENKVLFFFLPRLPRLPLELLLIHGKQLQIQEKDWNSFSQICEIHFLFLICMNGE